MKRKRISLLCIILSLIILKINIKLTNAQQYINLFDEILVQTKSETIEYGLKVIFETKDKELPEDIFNNLIKDLELDNEEVKLSSFEKKDSYCIEFLGENLKGYMESLKYNNKNVITINISKTSNENGLVSLKNKVDNSIGYRGKGIKYFQYLKAKVCGNRQNEEPEDILGVNENVVKILKSHGTKNIETVRISNGLSTVAYTKKYDEMLINNKLIDFNYAVCNYSSGSYIIIGTPEIIATY